MYQSACGQRKTSAQRYKHDPLRDLQVDDGSTCEGARGRAGEAKAKDPSKGQGVKVRICKGKRSATHSVDHGEPFKDFK